MVLSTTVYNAQLILYHHTGERNQIGPVCVSGKFLSFVRVTGKFLHSDITTGTEGQFALGLTHVGFGTLLCSDAV